MPRPIEIPHKDDKPVPGSVRLSGPWCPRCGHYLFRSSQYHINECYVCRESYTDAEIWGK